MATDLNPWEEEALMWTIARHPLDPHASDSESLIYPGLYSPSGIDILTILAYIHSRPSQTISLGAVDTSCALVICDLTQPDQPIVYASHGFTSLTGYTSREVTGRNCRFLQSPPRLQPLVPSLPFLAGTTMPIEYQLSIPSHPFAKSRTLQPGCLSPPPSPFLFQTTQLSSPALFVPQHRGTTPFTFPFALRQPLKPAQNDERGIQPAANMKRCHYQAQCQGRDRYQSRSQRRLPRCGLATTSTKSKEEVETASQVRAANENRRRRKRVRTAYEGGDGAVHTNDPVAKMREAVQGNQEVQVRVVNYKKNGEAFVNLVSIVPIPGSVLAGRCGYGDLFAGQRGREFALAVGFMCDLSESEENQV